MTQYALEFKPGLRRSYLTVSLGGREFGFLIEENPRDKNLYMRIDRGGKIIKAGAAVVAAVNLLGVNPNGDLPEGELYTYDLDADDPKVGRDPTIETFGDRILLVWDDGEES